MAVIFCSSLLLAFKNLILQESTKGEQMFNLHFLIKSLEPSVMFGISLEMQMKSFS